MTDIAMMGLRILVPMLVIVAGTLQAAEPISVDVPLQRKRTSDDGAVAADKIRFHFWMPAKAKSLRGIVFNPHYDQQPGQIQWQAACELWDFAILGANYIGVDQNEYGVTFKSGIAQLAKQSKWPELESAPLALIGISAGGSMAMSFAEKMPERTLAVAMVDTEIGPSRDTTRKIPTLTVHGDRKGKAFDTLLSRLETERGKGAHWGIIPHPGRKSDLSSANTVLLPYLADAIRLRLPRDGAAMPLREVDRDAGYLVQGLFHQNLPLVLGASIGDDAAKSGWFPGEPSAILAQSLGAKGTRLKILSPISLGEGQVFHAISAGSAFKARVTGAKSFKRVGVRLGRDVVKEARGGADGAEMTVSGISPGIYVMTAVGWNEKGITTEISAPVCLIVK